MGDERWCDEPVYIWSDGWKLCSSKGLMHMDLKTISLDDNSVQQNMYRFLQANEDDIFALEGLYGRAKIIMDTPWSGRFKVRSKCSRKAFKKWYMSKGASRDKAEEMCELVSSFKGLISYEDMYKVILFGYFG